MNNTPNKYIRADYRLFSVNNGQKELIEETTPSQPFDFVSGLGITLEAFENQIVSLNAGETFDFTLTPQEAYGEYFDDRVVDLDKELFEVNGKFDADHIYKYAIVMMQDGEGNRFNGRVLDITDDKVKMDLNHPLAGMTLNFQGQVLESRETTNEELAAYINALNGGHHCGHCHGEGHKDGHCCGHHGEGECCGKHEHGEGECCGKHGGDCSCGNE